MNLWVKSVRQLAVLAVASFFFSCEDEASLIGFKDPKTKFKVSYVEIPVSTTVLRIDSVITDNNSSPRILVGQYQDPYLGLVSTQSFVQMTPSVTTKLVEGSVYDSVTLQLKLDFYSYGVFGDQQIGIRIHELSERIDTIATTRYRYNSSIPYSSAILGEASVTVREDSLKKHVGLTAAQQDTVLLESKLDDTFGQRLFTLAFDGTTDFTDREKFTTIIKGLAFTPTQPNGILGIASMHNSLSKVVLHYHTVVDGVVKDTLERAFSFANFGNYRPNFTNITVDRGASEISAIAQLYQGIPLPSGRAVVESGNPVITKLDLSKFYDFADTVEHIVINQAEVVIGDVEVNQYEPIKQMVLKVLKNDSDLFMNYEVDKDSLAVKPFTDKQIIVNDYPHFLVGSDEPSQTPLPAQLSYSSSKNQYSGFMTFFLQNLYLQKDRQGAPNPDRLRYFGLFPSDPHVSSVHRTIFNGNTIKLRIHYTRPTSTVNP